MELERGLRGKVVEGGRVGWVIRGLETKASMNGLEKDEGRENEGNREGKWLFEWMGFQASSLQPQTWFVGID